MLEDRRCYTKKKKGKRILGLGIKNNWKVSYHFKYSRQDFPGDTVVKNPPVNAGDTGSSPGPGRSHVLWSN